MVPSHGELHRTGHQDTGGAHDRRATPAAWNPWNGAEVNRVGRSKMEVGVGATPKKKPGKMWENVELMYCDVF